MLGRCGLVLILHLKHDGNVLQAILIIVPEDIIALTSAFGNFIIFFEVGILKADGPHLIEGNLAVLLQRLAHHLRGLLRL